MSSRSSGESGESGAARSEAPPHRITLRAPEQPVFADVDPLRIEQVLSNLLDNAIKYSPQGGEIDLEVAPANGSVRLVVRDRGLGIPPEYRPHLFERFHQAHAASHVSGMGIGLSICRQIVEFHGGTIAAEFPDDGGTRFVITLPVTTPHAA